MFFNYIVYIFFTIISSSLATFKCPSLFNFYPDVHDCSKFYRCIWGKGAAFNCPSGTLWSHDLLTCNHAKEVKCDKSSVSEEMKHFEAPDFSVDIKKSKNSNSYDSKYDVSDDDGDDDNSDDNKTDNWGEEKEESHKGHKHSKDYSYYGNDDDDYGDVSSYETKGKKESSKYSSQKVTSGHHSPPVMSQDYRHTISHIPQPHHFMHHFQPTPYLLSAPQQYHSGPPQPQHYQSGPQHYQYHSGAPQPQQYQSGPPLQQYHAEPLLQQQYHSGPPQPQQYHSGPPPVGYILAPPKYVLQSQKQPLPEAEKSPTMAKDAKPTMWYGNTNSYMYNKLVQVPQLGSSQYYSPYVVNTDGTYDVIKVEVPSPEAGKVKPQLKLEPQIEKPPTEEDPWKETDLFRAGYGYKLIYHK